MTRRILVGGFCTLTILVLGLIFSRFPQGLTHPSVAHAEPVLQTTGSVSGHVYQSSGSIGIPNAEVCIDDYPLGNFYGCWTTDTNGYYSATGLPDGAVVRATARATGYATEMYDEVPYLGNQENATPINVVAGVDFTANFTLDPGGSIAGHVYAADNITPLPGVPVDTTPWGGFGTCTDSNGRFYMEGLPRNTDIFIYAGGAAWGGCSADGVYAQQYYNGKFTLGSADAIVLTDINHDATGKDFSLTVGGSISGTVTENGGGPVANVDVCANDYYTDDWVGCAMTDGNGSYTIGGIGDGDYRVNANASGYLFEYYDNQYDWNNADPVSVTAPNDTPNIDFVLEPGAVISGYVFQNDDTTPIPNAQVCIQDYPWGMNYGCYGTDQFGFYYADGVPDGTTVRVDAEADGYARELYNNVPYLGDNRNATPILAQVGSPQSGINFSLDLGGTISGTVRNASGTPLGGVPVDTVPWGGFGQCTDSNGQFLMSGLPQDTDIFIYAGGAAWGSCSEDGTFARQYYNGKSTLSNADAIVLTSGNPNAIGKDFTLTVGGAITGKVTQEDGITPIANVQVHVEDYATGGNWIGDTYTDTNGNYTINGLATGTYKVGAQAPGWTSEFFDNTFRWDQADPVNVTAGLTTPNINFKLGVGGTVSGRIVDEISGLGIANIVVDASYNGFGIGICTDQDGYYTLEHLPLSMDFRVQANWSTWCSGPNNYIPEFYNDKLNWNDAQIFNLDFATKDQYGIDFVLVKGGSISGRVTDEISGNGIGVGNICVGSLIPGGYGTCRDNILDPDGYYVLAGLPPGDYRVNVKDVPGHISEYYNDTGWNDADPVTVTAGNDTPNIDFPLARGGTVSGRVFDQTTGQPIANMFVSVNGNSPNFPEANTCTDNDGYYTVDGVPFDTDFTVSAGGWNHCDGGTWEYAKEWWQNVYYGPDATVLQISEAAPNKTGIFFALGKGGSITITVYDEDGVTPLAGVPVDTDPILFAECTGPDGTVTLNALPLGQPIIIHAGGGGWWGCDKKNYVREWWEESSTYEGATPITLTKFVPEATAEFTLTAGGYISGTVYDTDGTTPLGGAWVAMYNVTNDNWFGAGGTGPDGTFEIPGLAPSTYNLVVGKDGYAAEFYNDAQPGDPIYDFVITGGENIPNTDFVLGPEGTVSGTVYAKDGVTPLENIYVGVEDFMWPGACTAADGSYTINRLPQGVPLNVYAGGDDYCNGSSALYTKEWWEEVPDKASATAITLLPYQSGIDFTLETSAVPVLVAPANGDLLATARPIFEWQPIPGLTTFNLVVDDNSDFSSPRFDLNRTGTSFATPWAGLADGEWFWRMSVQLPDGNWSDWSEVWSFTIDTTKPAAPILIAPQNGSTVATDTPTFDWDPVDGATVYTIQIDTSNFFNSGNVIEETVTTDEFIPALPMSDAKWLWRVQAADDAGNMSAWSQTWNFVLDSQPTPAPALIAPADGTITNNRRPTFEWDVVADVDRYEIQVDDDPNFGSPAFTVQRTTTSYTHLYVLPNAEWYWHVRARGLDGNWGFWSDAWSFTLDTIPPIRPNLFAPANNATVHESQPTFQWEAVADAVSYQIQFDTNQFFNTANLVEGYSNTTQFIPGAPFVDQPWYWRVRATDAAGNSGLWSAIWRVYLDAVPTPIPTLQEPADQFLTNDRTPTFVWSEETGVVRYNILIDDDPAFATPRVNTNPFTATYTPNLTPLADGRWYWKVRALGADGNWGDYSAPWYVDVDATRPGRPNLISPSNGSNPGSNMPTFTWSDPGDADHYQIQIDRNFYFITTDLVEGYSNTTDWIPGSALADGRWYWRVRAIDAGGNIGTWSAVFNFFIDAVPTPVPSLTAPADTLQTRDRVFTFEWSNEAGVKRYNIQIDNENTFAPPYRVNANVLANTYTNGAFPLGNGVWYWRVRAQGLDDVWGAWSEMWMLEVDLVRPDRPVLVAPALGETIGTNMPTFEWTAMEDTVEYILQIDRNFYFRSADLHTYAGISTNMYTIPDVLFDGRWFWRVAAIDDVGNQSFWSANSRVFVDAVPTPVPTLSAPANNLLTNSAVHTFEWSAEFGVMRYNIQVDNENTFTAPMRVNANVNTNSFTNAALPLGNGVWYWRVRAQGTDGNWGGWSTVWMIDVDRVKPARPTLADPPNGSTTANNTPTFMWNAVPDADVVGYIIQIDKFYFFASTEKIQQQVTDTFYTPGTPLADRRWFWRVAAVDVAGNVGPWSQFWSVIIDAITAPAGQVIESDNAQVQRAGLWQRNTAPLVSGGSYLASKATPSSLTLPFTGSQIVIVYAKHATLGSFAIEIDGQVVQRINCRTSDGMKLTHVTIPVMPGEHTLRVVTVNGSVVIDAFIITP